MSKKRILSNGYTSYWRDDEPKPTPKVLTKEEKIIREAFGNERPLYEIYTSAEGMKAFDDMMKEELKNVKINENRIFNKR